MYEFTIGPLGEWSGTAKVIAKSSSIFEEIADVICVTVSSTLDYSPSTWKYITKAAGLAEYKKAFKKAKEGLKQWLNHGDILIVNTSETKIQKDDCAVCLKALDGDDESGEACELPCGHQYHVQCFEEYISHPSSKKCCPLCCKYFEIPMGDQPREAQMLINKNYHLKLPGHEDSEFTYEIQYSVPHGVQEASHIRPGKLFTGTQRRAYVPGTPEGTQVMRLLKFAFERRLTFTV
ncbi:DTC domain-containing protein, partial [Trichostrongylus colubriformis]